MHRLNHGERAKLRAELLSQIEATDTVELLGGLIRSIESFNAEVEAETTTRDAKAAAAALGDEA